MRLPRTGLPPQAAPHPPGPVPTSTERLSVRRARKSKHVIANALMIISLWVIALAIFASGIAQELDALRLPA
ncbi:hypothetical protein SSCG_04875 [Streptomyces clavuligerus]|nr:hypothetical protein SSCG_04875 [Streptomyces clavuligerus]